MDRLVPPFGPGNTGVRNVSNAVSQPALDPSGEGSIMNAITPMSPNFDPTLQANTPGAMPNKSPMSDVHAYAARQGIQLPQQSVQPQPQQPSGGPVNPLQAATQPGQQDNPKTLNGEAEIILQTLSDRLSHINKKELSALKRFESTVNPGVKPPQGHDSMTGNMVESMQGWQPGQKSAFDTAVLMKDAHTVQQMLGSVPEYYKKQLADQIEKVIGQTPKTGAETAEWYKRNELP